MSRSRAGVWRVVTVAFAVTNVGCHEFITEPGPPRPATPRMIVPEVQPIREVDTGPVLSAHVIEARFGQPLGGSQLTLIRPGHGRDSVADRGISDRSGRFAFRPMPPGRYTLVIRAIGFHQQRIAVTIQPDESPEIIAIVMVTAPICTMEEIVITTKP
jgi:hypothetical protein